MEPVIKETLPVPDDILAGWRALVATGAHVHLPQIAAHLQVPQAALLAARIGTGATRLQPDLVAVLRPIKQWHRVLLVASSDLGVFMPMDHVAEFHEDSTGVTLSGEALSTRIDPSLIHELYIFEDSETGPGTSKSIQAFDGAGDPLLKVVMFHKPSFRAALDWTAGYTHPDQSREWHPAPGTAHPGPMPEPPTGDVAVDPLHFAETLEAARVNGQALTVRARGPGLDLAWHGELTKVRRDGAMVHLHEHTLRAHLNLAKAREDTATRLHVSGQVEPALEILEGEA